MMNYACTLYERQYHFGAAVLINSLQRNGFQGTFFVGYRGDLPEWAQNRDEFRIGEDVTIKFIPISTTRHLTNEKPFFLLRLLSDFVDQDSKISYFDPDITLRCSWSTLNKYSEYGILLIEDSTSPYMPSNHPVRLQWIDFAKTIDLTVNRSLDRYYNAGYIAVGHNDISFLETWCTILEESCKIGYDIVNWNVGDRSNIWNCVDQDHLNLTVMVTNNPIATFGPEEMDFQRGGHMMSHAVGKDKPWNSPFIANALQGIPPTHADRVYWKNADFPLAPFSQTAFKKKRLELQVGIAISRFIRR